MTNAEKMEMLMVAFTKIFLSKTKGTDITKETIVTNTGTFAGRSFVDGLLRGFDFTANVGDRIVELRCLEQNPNKTDQFGNLKKFALLARQGHQIMWIIDRKVNKWLGRIMDGQWEATFTPATTPASTMHAYNANGTHTVLPPEVQDYGQAKTYIATAPATPNQYDNTAQRAAEDAAYAHIDHDYNDPNFHGIPGTSGTPMANLPIKTAMPQNLPGWQNPAAASDPYIEYLNDDAPVSIEDLPEIPDNVGIPDYVLQDIDNMDEPPWEEY